MSGKGCSMIFSNTEKLDCRTEERVQAIANLSHRRDRRMETPEMGSGRSGCHDHRLRCCKANLAPYLLIGGVATLNGRAGVSKFTRKHSPLLPKTYQKLSGKMERARTGERSLCLNTITLLERPLITFASDFAFTGQMSETGDPKLKKSFGQKNNLEP